MIKNYTQKGFTLIELMVVISIAGLIFAIVLSSLKEASDRSIATKFKSEIQQFMSALELYKADTGSYPYEGGWGNSTFINSFRNNNTVGRSPAGGTSNISTFLVPKYLKVLPQVPNNPFSPTGFAWYYYANKTLDGITAQRFRCVGDQVMPAYVILISNQNPFLFSAYSSSPFYQTSSEGVTWSPPNGNTSARCISLK